MPIIFIYFTAINFISYIVMAGDKKKARKKKYRTSENTLWLLALLGGAPGSFVAMRTHRHKTKHAAFKYGMPILAVLDLFILGMIGGVM
ncbi:DUF1294 domain-containing protein [Domibacillus epiphyticus]|uniref:DUF1294 domain-containing protein n=1 Tax=Domibacillus epiphyticus TaxID=1714355 RepID=A0A1V2A8Z9_9BACI|nr:DUF1294 domain-containing protein [Domibacillus epiphyticus]OMP67485.1 hypothetical protein BTO28_05935 [Domibacillus epiphyticus]